MFRRAGGWDEDCHWCPVAGRTFGRNEFVMDHFDLIVIGSGPAGQKAAIAAAKLGRSAAVVERRNMVGGVCINTGTIPSKTLREAVLYRSEERRVGKEWRSRWAPDD